MIPISSITAGAISGGFAWSRSGSGYQLKLNDKVVGSLRRTSFWSADHEAESSYGQWKFCRGGTLGTGAQILDASNLRVATFKQSWGGAGSLTFADGQTFRIVAKGCWRPVWNVTAADGQAALQIRTRDRAVEIEKQTVLQESRLLLLVLFVFYRMQQAEQDGAVAAMVAGIS
ncbi:MAG TPA: hypothetical protein VKR60_14205 [Candidatus Sulfotelmatobacter sp.]|nr:hypothetical protein [Candidatus Sulfotelmatobacter sp.]